MPTSLIWRPTSSGLSLGDLPCLAHDAIWYLDQNWFGHACPYLWLARLQEGVAQSFAFLLVSRQV
jgi:hypothetical protein